MHIKPRKVLDSDPRLASTLPTRERNPISKGRGHRIQTQTLRDDGNAI